MINKILKSAICFLVPLSLWGQVPPISDQYILNPLSINPAYAGGRGTLNIAAFYRRQWIGITGAPETMSLAIDGPLTDGKLGLGFTIMNDKIGVTKETAISSKYSYNIDLGGGNLSMGLGAGIITTNTAWSDLVVLDPGDEFYLIDSRVFVVPDFSFGLYYLFDNFFAGFSVPRLLSYQFNFDKNRFSIRSDPARYYYLISTGYRFSLTQKTQFLPSTLISFSPGEKVIMDINAHFSYDDKLWFGTSYRTNRSLAGLFQYAVNNQVKVGYSYYFDFNEIGSFSNGSHEIMLRYEFRYRIDVVNPLIF
jgi:type IX secretion system PorP/SprF family membrane protein